MTNKTYIIAEAGVNHNGDINKAIEMVKAAADAGVDAVKFQTFKAENLASKKIAKADYQKKNTGESESQYEMLKALELKHKDHFILRDECQKYGVDFLSTPFDSVSLKFLVDEMKIEQLKVSSGDTTNAPLLLEMAATEKPIILSTGMCMLEDVERALGVIAFGYLRAQSPKDWTTPGLNAFKLALNNPTGQQLLKAKLSLLHCTTEYPAPVEEVNLAVMDGYKIMFDVRVGYSDHTQGIAIPIAAVARGAEIIEKHITLDRNLPGPDHNASIEIDELTAMVKAIRQVEVAVGNPRKQVMPSERKNMDIARKTIVANENIKKGEQLTESNLAIKRAGAGPSPYSYWDLLGAKAERDYDVEDII